MSSSWQVDKQVNHNIDKRWSDFTFLTPFVSSVALQWIHTDPPADTAVNKNGALNQRIVF